LQQAREKLQEQIQQNEARRKRIEEHKSLVTQRRQAQILVQTFKNAIEAILNEKREKVANPYMLKEQLQPGDKKRILELFVENDNTLSHLLEFISSKLVDPATN
jgi:predicted AlkP superfamily phosphohydrolase/phosphomutase